MNAVKKLFKVMIASFLTVASLTNTNTIKAMEGNNDALAESDTQIYTVQEDAYIRQGRNSNYNFESIGKAHGAQYVGKNIKTLSSKYGTNDEIITLLKFDLPTKEDLNIYDRYELEFNIFKNANFNEPTQTYEFYYTPETNWKETELTWNNKPEAIDRTKATLAASFTIDQGNEYEFKSDDEKKIRVDVTQAVEKMVNDGLSEATFFITGKNASGTSMLIHDRTSGQKENDVIGDKAAKIIASHSNISLDSLNSLIQECEKISSNDYTSDSYQNMQKALKEAKAFVETNPTDAKAVRDMYDKLLQAKNALVSVLDPEDGANVAYKKPTRSNLSKDKTNKVNDGDYASYWSGKFYPSYVDIDLMDTYAINNIELSFPKDKVIYYTLYGSNDGKTYDELYQSRSNEKKTNKADVVTFEQAKSYRIIRVYLEYTQNENSAYLSEVKVYGTKTDTNTEALRQGTFEEITGLKDFEDTAYAKPITNEETIENVYGIIDRIIGKEYRSWFTIEIAENTVNTNDYFELSDQNGKVHIKANSGVNLSAGLNYYFKNYVNIQVSEQTISGTMPKAIVPIGKTVRKETPLKIRYAFNYCTLSYTFAFFGEEEWQRENDWLALNGVNVVLDLAGQEATWIKFLMNYGYSFDDAKDWLVGPGYQAWQFMDNMEVFGGPLPDGYVIDRVELARKSQRWKRSLGMETVLQGYAGMVPTDFNDYQPNVKLVAQGSWNGFSRPSMLATDSEDYDKMAKDFYEAQRFVYGETSDYYAVDPFHEGGKRPTGLTDDKISKEVLESMLAYDKDAVWTVQGWQSNPTDKLLEGMGENREDHVLVVDLIKYPLVSSGEAQYKKNEFQGTSWAWCLLGNFGGNPTMNGEIQTMTNEILDAKKNSKHLKGIGIISEATYDNPMIYDLLFDLAWTDETFNLDKWIDRYIERRYGGTSANVKEAWKLIKNANYNEGVRLTKELFGVRTGGVPRKIGKEKIGYDIKDLENALRLLLEDYDKFKDSEGYRYDLSEIMRQVVSNYALYKYHDVIDARDAKDLEKFRKEKAEFLNAFDVLNEVSRTQQEQLAGEWIGKAQDRSADYDDFSRSTFEMNAKSLITTWGSVDGALIDYGFRTYEGMFLDVRKSNWIEYLDQVEQNLIDGSPITTPTSAKGYAHKYWKWVIGDQTYTRDATDSPEEILEVANKVLDECTFAGELDPNIGNIALDRKVKVNDHADFENAEVITDGDNETAVKISSYAVDGTSKNPMVVIDLLAEFDLSKIQVVGNVEANQVEIYTSTDAKKWEKISVASKAENVFENINANGRYVKVQFANSDVELNEIRVYGDRMLPNLEQLQRLVNQAEQLDTSGGTKEQIDTFNKALAAAKKAIDESAAPDTVNTVYWNLYDAMVVFSTNKDINIALGKTVKAHNDPGGNSQNINDGNLASSWNGGRLSATGKPYEDTITPGWAWIDLDGLYDINQIQVLFENEKYWHQYEIYTSLDGENWDKIGEKKTQTLPNEKEDSYKLNHKRARYVVLYATNVQVGSGGKRNDFRVTEFQVYGKKVILNKDALQTAIKLANEKVENEYTTETWKQFKEVLTKAEEIVSSDTVSQTEIDDITAKLENTMKALKYKTADYSAVDAAVAKAKALNPTDYVDFSGVEKALAAVKYDLDITKQAEVDGYAKAINDAIEALERKPIDPQEPVNKEDLQEAVDKASKLEKEDYTEESWKVFEEAYTNAKDVLSNEEATAKEVEEAKNALSEAIEQLKPVETKPITPEEPEKPNKGDSTNTGDHTNAITYAALLAGSGLLLGGILLNKKRRGTEKNK